jgi:hypothetical protein
VPPHLTARLDEYTRDPDPDSANEADYAQLAFEERPYLRVLHGMLHDDLLLMEGARRWIAALTAPLCGPWVGAVRGRTAEPELRIPYSPGSRGTN